MPMERRFKIRKYRDEDADGLIECTSKLQDYLVEKDTRRLYTAFSAPGAKKFASELVKDIKAQQGIIYVVESDGEIGGYICGCIMKLPAYFKKSKFSQFGYVMDLFIKPELRGQKVGYELMKRIENYFRKTKCQFCTLDVTAFNTNAIAFYEKLGYEERKYNMIKMI